VGTSYTQFGQCGFWTRDAALETALALLVIELEPFSPDSEMLDSWTLQAVVGFGGSVSAELDRFVKDTPTKTTVLAALSGVLDGLPDEGLSEPADSAFLDRAAIACGDRPWRMPSALVQWVREVIMALSDLLEGGLPETPNDFWFVDGDGRHLRPRSRTQRP
jgi:hypothetical protein